jgi:hypothetical protein
MPQRETDMAFVVMPEFQVEPGSMEAFLAAAAVEEKPVCFAERRHP